MSTNLKFKFIFFLILPVIFACNNDRKTNSSQEPTSSRQLAEESFQELYQYYTSDPRSLFEQEQNAIIDYAVKNQLNLRRSPSGLFYEIREPGQGDSIKWGDQIRTHYRGKFLDGREFDSSYKRGAPIEFKVGGMVAAWNEGFRYMTKGSKAIIISPSHLGYGKRGFPGFVGPDMVLVFEVDIGK